MKRDKQRPAEGRPGTNDGGRLTTLYPEFLQDLVHWIVTDTRLALRLLRVVQETIRTPFEGIGKPELLRHSGGAWSRRLDGEHRITYYVTAEAVYFITARHHYAR